MFMIRTETIALVIMQTEQQGVGKATGILKYSFSDRRLREERTNDLALVGKPFCQDRLGTSRILPLPEQGRSSFWGPLIAFSF